MRRHTLIMFRPVREGLLAARVEHGRNPGAAADLVTVSSSPCGASATQTRRSADCRQVTAVTGAVPGPSRGRQRAGLHRLAPASTGR
jgi:hypothetical protein